MRRRLPAILFFLLLAGCSLPRVIVLHDPLGAREHNDLGVAYQQRGEFDLAAREYSRAAELDGHWSLPLVNRGNVRAARGDWRGAAADYRRALTREPRDAEAMNNLAWALLQSGEADAALPWAERATAARPGVPAFLDTLADVHWARGDFLTAVRLLEQALSLSSDPGLQEFLAAKRRQFVSSPP